MPTVRNLSGSALNGDVVSAPFGGSQDPYRLLVPNHYRAHLPISMAAS
jgi:hypothetical protein